MEVTNLRRVSQWDQWLVNQADQVLGFVLDRINAPTYIPSCVISPTTGLVTALALPDGTSIPVPLGAGAGTVTNSTGGLTGNLAAGQVVLGNGGFDITGAGFSFVGTPTAVYTFPAGTDTMLGASTAETATNLRVKPRTVYYNGNAATIPVNTDVTDILVIGNLTPQTTAITGFTFTGTPAEGEFLQIKVFPGSTAAVAFGAAPVSAGLAALPIQLNGTNESNWGFVYDGKNAIWQCQFNSPGRGVVNLSANSATPAINTNFANVVNITAQTAAITSFTTNLTGTPNSNDPLIVNITGTAAVGLTWGTGFEASTVALPTTTVGTTMLSVGFKYNGATSKWRCVAVA